MDVNFLKNAHKLKKERIQERLQEFSQLKSADNDRLFEELCFCILTANTSAKMGIKSIATIKTKLASGSQEQLAEGLTGVYRFPNKRSEYIAATRNFLQDQHNFDIRSMLDLFDDVTELREYLVKNIKGYGHKEASHFLRNIGYKNLCILDKHILSSMVELGVLEENTPPRNREQYVEIENKLKQFSNSVNIDVDEMDLLLWSLKTGEILK